MKIDDVKRIIAENKIKMDFIRINDNYLISGIYYLYYEVFFKNIYYFILS